MQRILSHLRVRSGHDFSSYKKSTIRRRIARRMQVQRAATMADYLGVLRENPQEAQALFADLLISVTTFFRDTSAFDKLAAFVIPRLFDDKGVSDTIRVWVPGCATGEEAYSIAMLLLEEAAVMTSGAGCRSLPPISTRALCGRKGGTLSDRHRSRHDGRTAAALLYP